MKRYVKMHSQADEVREICGDITYCATVDGCIDDNYFDTLEEAENFAREEEAESTKYKKITVSICKLVWNHKNEEYDFFEV